MSDIVIICDIDHIVLARLVADGEPPYPWGYLNAIAKTLPNGEHAYLENEIKLDGEKVHIGCFYNGSWAEHISPCAGYDPTEEGFVTIWE
jgi:hypothetical protein